MNFQHTRQTALMEVLSEHDVDQKVAITFLLYKYGLKLTPEIISLGKSTNYLYVGIDFVKILSKKYKIVSCIYYELPTGCNLMEYCSYRHGEEEDQMFQNLRFKFASQRLKSFSPALKREYNIEFKNECLPENDILKHRVQALTKKLEAAEQRSKEYKDQLLKASTKLIATEKYISYKSIRCIEKDEEIENLKKDNSELKREVENKTRRYEHLKRCREEDYESYQYYRQKYKRIRKE